MTDKTEASSQRLTTGHGSLPQPSPPERPRSLPQPMRTRPTHLTPAALQQTATAPPRRTLSTISTSSDSSSSAGSPAERALSLRRVLRQIGRAIAADIADDCEALDARARTLGRLALVSKAVRKRAVPVLYERWAVRSHDAVLALAGRFDDRWRSDVGSVPQMRELVVRVGVDSLSLVAKLVRLCPKLTDFDLEVDGGGEGAVKLALPTSHKLVAAIGGLDRLRRLAILFDGKTIPLCTVNALVRSPHLVEVDLLNVVLPTAHPWSDGTGWAAIRTLRLHEPRLTAYELDKVLRVVPRLRTLELIGNERPLAVTPAALHDVLRGWSGPRPLRRVVVETGITVDWRAKGEALGRLAQLCEARLGIDLAVDCTA